MEQMDQGDTIVYSIVGDYSDLFAVGSSNGMITTKVALDREEKGSYILRIQATDTGTPPLSSMTQVSGSTTTTTTTTTTTLLTRWK